MIINGNTDTGVQTIIGGVAAICVRDGISKVED